MIIYMASNILFDEVWWKKWFNWMATVAPNIYLEKLKLAAYYFTRIMPLSMSPRGSNITPDPHSSKKINLAWYSYQIVDGRNYHLLKTINDFTTFQHLKTVYPNLI